MTLLFGVILLLLGYIVYQDIANRKEREALELKLMSKDVTEYKVNTSPPPKPLKEDPDDNVDTDEVPLEKLMRAKDNL